jgi:hypothetical protein
MSEKTKRIIGWVLTGLVSFIFIGSALGKLTGNAEALKMAETFGINAKAYFTLGLIEMACLILFIMPRTGILGTILLSAYMGGAIATHLEHQVSVMAPCIIQTILLLVAAYRFPELKSRIFSSAK